MASAAGEAYQSTVFIATSLDTRLLTMVSASDTVSDFKKKVTLEHRQCFPAIGNIRVDSLKVKRRGVFYHLSDSMLVKSAFGTTEGNWFVSVDASSLEQDIDIQHFDKHKAGDVLALPWVTLNGSIKDVSKHLEEDRPSDDKQLAANKKTNSKERTCDVSNGNLLKDPSGCGLSEKKKRKTQRVKSNVKASEENESKDKDLIGENIRINNGEARYDLDRVAAVVSSSLEGVGRETVADVAMVVEKNIQHGMAEKYEENEPVQKAVMENEIPSSLTRASDCERDAAGLTVVAPLKGAYKHKAAEKEVSSTSFIKNLHNINKDAIDSPSQQDTGPNCQDSQGHLIHKHKEDIEFSLKQGREVKLPERRKKVKKSAARYKNETLVMHADDNLLGDISSTILAPVLDEKIIGEKNAVLETTLIDYSKKNDEMIVKEMEVSEPTKSYRNRVRVESMEEKSNNKIKDIVGSRKRKKDVVNQSNDVATSMGALHVDSVRNDNILMNNDAELLRTEKNLSEVKVGDTDDKSEKQNEKMDGVKKSTRKRKTKKSASRNEDVTEKMHIVKEGDSSLPDSGKEDAQPFYEQLEGKAEKKNNKSSLMGPQDQLSKYQSTEVELESKKSQSIDHRRHLEDTSKNLTLSEVSKVNNKMEDKKAKKKKSLLMTPQDRLSKHQSTEVELESKKSQSIDHHHHMTESEVSKVNNEAGSHEINFMDYFAPGHQPNKVASIDNGKDTKKPKKKTKDDSRNDGALRSWKMISKNENNKVVTAPNVPNIDQIKTPTTTRNIVAESSSSSKSFGRSFHHQKSNKQQSVVGPVKKISPAVNKLLNTPGKIFGDDDSDRSYADDNATVNSDSSTRTPSRKPASSSSSSSSGESAYSIDSRRNRSHARKRKEGGGMDRMMSQNKLKNMSMSDLLRSSSRFKKAKFTASQVEDTESQSVDFVPDSQP